MIRWWGYREMTVVVPFMIGPSGSARGRVAPDASTIAAIRRAYRRLAGPRPGGRAGPPIGGHEGSPIDRHRADRAGPGPARRPRLLRRPGGATRPGGDGPAAPIRQRRRDRIVTAWATTPFEVLAARSVPGGLEPADVAVPAAALLTALTVERAAPSIPAPARAGGPSCPRRPAGRRSAPVPPAELAELAERALAAPGSRPRAPSCWTRALTVPDPAGPAVRVPLRCLFALSGLGLLAETGPARPIGVSATRSWLRLDAPHGGGPAPPAPRRSRY